ncbi:hypothetical protein C8R45DRAFT_1047060 [Mycena sanguinolenta]|nr:hypothetical protein C8R45DRAFT_1047060 [Mycena sanguinolenta]
MFHRESNGLQWECEDKQAVSAVGSATFLVFVLDMEGISLRTSLFRFPPPASILIHTQLTHKAARGASMPDTSSTPCAMLENHSLFGMIVMCVTLQCSQWQRCHWPERDATRAYIRRQRRAVLGYIRRWCRAQQRYFARHGSSFRHKRFTTRRIRRLSPIAIGWIGN